MSVVPPLRLSLSRPSSLPLPTPHRVDSHLPPPPHLLPICCPAPSYRWSEYYEDRPSRLAVVRVADRTVIATTPDETQCTAPDGLQVAIDALVAEIDPESGRSFVRPSGTEDVVRVYAEASTQENADALALRVQQAVYDMAGGVNERP